MKKIIFIFLLFYTVNSFSQSYNNNLHIYNIALWGAKPATILYAAGSISSSSSTLTVTGASFTSSDVGKIILVKRAGTSGRDLITTIAGFTSSTVVTTTAAAASTVSNAQVVYGTDCTTAVQGAVNAADANFGGIVWIPTGTFLIGGALQTSVGGVNMNSQIYLPYHAHTSNVENHIVFRGEAKPIAAPQGGGLSADQTTMFPATGSNLYSTLASGGATDAAVIGTGASSGFNASTLSIENLQIIVANNPSGSGAIVGGVSMKLGASLQVSYSAVIIDTTAFRSVFPANDVTGFQVPDNGSQTFNTFINTLVVGMHSGYKFSEHCILGNVQCMSCYYSFFFKDGFHSNESSRLCSFWSAYDIYVATASGKCNFINMNLDVEWQQIGKWYDNVNTIKDSANTGAGNIFYEIVQAGFGVNQSKFSKSGGSGINAYSYTAGIASLPISLTSGVSGTLPVANGGTGNNGLAQGDIIYGSAVNTFSALTKDINSTRYLSNQGTSNNPAWTQVSLSQGVSGTLPIANGGTNNSSAYTGGSVLFSNGTSVIQDNAKLNWDDNNFLLGVGTSTHSDANGNNALRVLGTAGTDVFAITDGTANMGFYVNAGHASRQFQLGTTTAHNIAWFTNNGAAQFSLVTDGGTIIGTPAALTDVYRTTNGGSDLNGLLTVNTGSSISTAGSQAFAFDNTNGFIFEAANGTREIARAAIKLTSLTNTAGSETGDLAFYTKPSGGAIANTMTLSAAGNLTVGAANNIVGTATNNNATAGNIGEEVNSTISTYTNYTTTATYQNVTSISLTAGDWDISAFASLSSNTATITAASNAIFVISTTTASAAGATEGKNIAYIPQAALLGTSIESTAISPFRVSLSGTTIYYLNTQATFTIGNPQFAGTIRARRVR